MSGTVHIAEYLGAFKLFERATVWSAVCSACGILGALTTIGGRLDVGGLALLAALMCVWRARVLLARGRRLVNITTEANTKAALTTIMTEELARYSEPQPRAGTRAPDEVP